MKLLLGVSDGKRLRNAYLRPSPLPLQELTHRQHKPNSRIAPCAGSTRKLTLPSLFCHQERKGKKRKMQEKGTPGRGARGAGQGPAICERDGGFFEARRWRARESRNPEEEISGGRRPRFEKALATHTEAAVVAGARCDRVCRGQEEQRGGSQV